MRQHFRYVRPSQLDSFSLKQDLTCSNYYSCAEDQSLEGMQNQASLHFSGPAFKIGRLCVMVYGLGSELGFGNGALGLVRVSLGLVRVT